MDAAAASRQPKHFLLQVVVSTDLSTTVLSYYDGLNAKKKLNVNVGDRVAFLVQLALPSGRKPIAYEVTFTNQSFFGLSSLHVPAGGVSSFLIVNSLRGQTSYSVTSPGLGCILDPEIQSGPDGFDQTSADITVATFRVTWNLSSDTNNMTYTKNADSTPRDFPMTVSLNDKIDFALSGSDADGLDVNFSTSQDQNSWATPFGPDLYIVQNAGAATQIVKDYLDGTPGNPAPFSFFGTALLCGVKTSSPEYTINLE